MMAEGRNFLGVATYLTFYPGAAITLTALGLNLLGDGLRDRLDPRFIRGDVLAARTLKCRDGWMRFVRLVYRSGRGNPIRVFACA